MTNPKQAGFGALSATVDALVLVKLAPEVLVNPAHIVAIMPSPQAALTRIVLVNGSPIDLADLSPSETAGRIMRAVMDSVTDLSEAH